ncbi:hypothetical protein F4560_006944 [Saccharothrix ecbatanensis]|uniref:Type II toxin-antitoxin system RelE/ParE family toxin n=1 Tax=Saccharothrix ecbatanensis TaxID=1105145 RepID=A0A7W9M4J5_9PSEU|nr:hypothetical protein [Saccharothrix ecbatanensis]MBB5807176.1 hypothetical protein [Saccharothrix ecbatanensis]
MSPKRGDRVAPPPRRDEWDVLFADNDSAKGWEELCGQAPGNTFEAWHSMRTDPVPRLPVPRHHPLKGKLSHEVRGGRLLPKWQIEVTGGGRVWYFVDAERRTVWLVWAGTGHPKATE